MDKVAIIILNWNSTQITIDCLESLLQINYVNYKIYLVDNGSLDNPVLKIKKKFVTDYIRYVKLNGNYGFTGGNNIGIKAAKEEYKPNYFLLLNNDTIVDPDFLKNLIAPFSSNKKIGIVVPKIFFYEPSNYIYYAGGYINLFSGLGEHYFGKQLDKPDKTNIAKKVNFANGCSMLIKKEVIEIVGLLDDMYFANIEDVDYSYRTQKKGFEIFYSPKAVIWHREGYASKKNLGNWFRIYLCTRNVILFQKKRTKLFFIFCFLPYFFIRWVIYMILKFSFKIDFKSCKMIFFGISDGFSGKLRFVNKPRDINVEMS